MSGIPFEELKRVGKTKPGKGEIKANLQQKRLKKGKWGGKVTFALMTAEKGGKVFRRGKQPNVVTKKRQ